MSKISDFWFFALAVSIKINAKKAVFTFVVVQELYIFVTEFHRATCRDQSERNP